MVVHYKVELVDIREEKIFEYGSPPPKINLMSDANDFAAAMNYISDTGIGRKGPVNIHSKSDDGSWFLYISMH
jgi:hypothetical protein